MFELCTSGFIQVGSTDLGYDGNPITKTPTEINDHSLLIFAVLLFVLGIITQVLYARVAFLINRYLKNRYNHDDVSTIVVTPDNETVIFFQATKH